MLFLDIVYFLPFALRKLPEAFWLKSHQVMAPALLKYASESRLCRKISDISCYGIDEMNASERNEVLA